MITQQRSHIKQTIVSSWTAWVPDDPQRGIEDIHSKRSLFVQHVAYATCRRKGSAVCPHALLRQTKCRWCVRLESAVNKVAADGCVGNESRHPGERVGNLK